MKSWQMGLALSAVLALAACDEENATILRGTFVEDGAPGEFFMHGDATKALKCVYDGKGDNPGVSGAMIEYPVIGGGEIRARGGWRAMFVQAEYNRVRVVVRSQGGEADPEVNKRVRGWLDECSWNM